MKHISATGETYFVDLQEDSYRLYDKWKPGNCDLSTKVEIAENYRLLPRFIHSKTHQKFIVCFVHVERMRCDWLFRGLLRCL